jgi:4'-phosphopantetheinyl transferase
MQSDDQTSKRARSSPIFLPLTDQFPDLPADEVAVFAWKLDRATTPEDWSLLDERETGRARRFVFPRDRERFVRAHSVLRRVLAAYSRLDPGKIRFHSNAHGKPEISLAGSDLENRGSTASVPPRFNLSHSGDIALLGVSRTCLLGTDIEVVRAIDAGVAEHHFSESELHTLRSLPKDRWPSGFFRCWTSKEALLKGEGLGLNLPLNAFDVEADPERAPALRAVRPPAEALDGWRLFDVRPTEDAMATLAVRGETGSLPVAIHHYFLPW